MFNSVTLSLGPDGPLSELRAAEMAVVHTIQSDSPLSRTELARRLGYSRATITPIVAGLLESGILTEKGHGSSSGGRRPQMLAINGELGYAAGIDIGATSVAYVLADLNGQPLERFEETADVRVGPEALLSHVCAVLQEMIARQPHSERPLLAAGIGVPGPVEFSTGMLIAPPLMPTWEGFPIREFMARSFPAATVVVDNDVNIMALGEQKAGAGQDIDNFFFIKIGTGIGCGIICEGSVYRGSNGCAGDVGHICVDYNGPVCHCGNQGCVEFMAAGPAIARKAMEAAAGGNSPLMAKQLAEKGTLTAVDVGEAAAAGDRAAGEIIRESGRMIGGVLAGLVNFYNPAAIFIGGGVSEIGYQLLSSIRRATLNRATPLSTRELRIEYASLGQDAGVLGALWLALDTVFALEHM
jgi:glucokinase-like ROK family protein